MIIRTMALLPPPASYKQMLFQKELRREHVLEFSSSISNMEQREISTQGSAGSSKATCIEHAFAKRDGEVGKGKSKKMQKNRRHRWKPYHKMSWAERLKLEKNETKRANRIRKKMFEQGQAIAPYNTTQFLMADHIVEEPNYDLAPQNLNYQSGFSSNDSSDECGSSEEYMCKQFTEDYDIVHVERLNGMSKSELVQEYMLLEGVVEELERKCRDSEHCPHGYSMEDMEGNRSSEMEVAPVNDDFQTKINVFKKEIDNLRKENERLRLENEKLSQLDVASDTRVVL